MIQQLTLDTVEQVIRARRDANVHPFSQVATVEVRVMGASPRLLVGADRSRFPTAQDADGFASNLKTAIIDAMGGGDHARALCEQMLFAHHEPFLLPWQRDGIRGGKEMGAR